ncbi:gluconolactonase [Flavobacterium sp. Sd200]|uniref:SMP-30/gluconolactonase/LRE family protein n=1 Tax=Flavobacterium sp. Sd200 TaxID=2692211 RepID=UPI00136E6397|nr:L-dopachrome tautomerase-related protein [Flavobacterium sp. Sd200]MXN93044.1 gluconolactonase [Flavobacterium sp. Sd200]
MKNLIISILIAIPLYAQKPQLEEVADVGKNQPIGVAVESSTNRLFVSFPHNEPFMFALTEIKNGRRVAYPNEEWNKQGTDDKHFNNVQDLYADDKGSLWVLDSKPAGGASVFGDSGSAQTGEFKLIQFDLASNTAKKVYRFGGLPLDKSGLNDVRVDTQKQLAYLSDPALKAIVVLDLKTDTVRIVLQDDASTTATPRYTLKIDGVEMTDENNKPFVSNVNSIALTKDNNYFYYKPINHDRLYRIRTKHLANTKLSAEDITFKVEKIADVGMSHGLECDAKGNIYYGDSQMHAIRYVTRFGKVKTLVIDGRIIWPDSFGVGSDGYLYFSCAQLNRQPKYNNQQSKVDLPYRIYRVKMPN